MGFFDFIAGLDAYGEHRQPVPRMNLRHAHLIAPFAAELKGARVLDLAAHDGRWSYALAGAGAAEVIGVEARPELTARFADYPETPFKPRVTLRCNDLFAEMEAEAGRGARYDVVAVFGIFYHVMDHFRLFQLARRLNPRLILVDSEFLLRPNPVIQLVRERTDNILNAVAQVPGQEFALKGIPSLAAMEAIAEALGYRTSWVDWAAVPEAERGSVRDYFREEKMRRATCALRPAQP